MQRRVRLSPIFQIWFRDRFCLFFIHVSVKSQRNPGLPISNLDFAFPEQLFLEVRITYWRTKAHGTHSGSPRRLRPLSTRRFGQPRRLGSRRASSPSGARAGGLSAKACAPLPGSAPPPLTPPSRRSLLALALPPNASPPKHFETRKVDQA